MKYWIINYEVDDDNYEGAPRMKYSDLVTAPTAQDAVNKLRRKYRTGDNLKIHAVYLTDSTYRNWKRKSNDWK